MISKQFISEEREEIELAFEYEKKYHIPATDALSALKIKKNCQPFLQACKAKDDPFILYRGVQEDQTFIKKDVRLNDRRPLTMKNALHKKINIYMDDNYGHPYRNAMFCTGDLDSADYGSNTYWVFPTGDYDFIYSNNTLYDDLFLAWQKYKVNIEMPEQYLIHQDDVVEKFLANANYKSDSILNAAESQSEIMIWTDNYYGVRSDYEHWEELTEIMYD